MTRPSTVQPAGRLLRNALAILVLAVASDSACSRDPGLAKEDFLRRGQEYTQQKKFHEAAIEYANALKLDEKYGEAELGLGNTYYELGDYPRAAASFARAADLLPEDLNLQLRAGSMRLLSRDYEEARALADRVLAKEPANLLALLLRANALAGIDGVDSAVRQIEAAIALDPQRAELYTNLGSLQAAGGRLAAAESAFRQAIAIAPREPRAHLALANFFWEARRLPEAERAFLKALEFDPSNRQASRILATFYLATGRPALAEPYLKAVADNGADIAAQLRLADYYALYGKREQALALLQALTKRPDGFVPASTRIAAWMYAAGQRDEGYRLVQEVLTRNPADAPAQQLLAHFLFMEKKPDEAMRRAQAALQSDPRLESAHMLSARIHLSKGNVSDATLVLQKLLQINPRAVAAQTLLAQLQADAGYTDLAVALASSAVANTGGAAQTRLALVRILFTKGDFNRAASELAALRRDFPHAPAVLSATGDLHLLKKEYPEARKAFDSALSQDPSALDAISGLVAVDLLTGQAEAARKRVEEQLARTPDRTAVLLLGARTYGALRDFGKAEALMKRAIATNPASIEAYGMLGQFLYQQGRLDEGRREFEKLVQQQPRNVSALTMLAIIVNRLGQPDEAIRRYEEILAIDADAAVAANNLAWMYAEQNRQLDRAVQLATTAVRRLPDEPAVADTLAWAYVRKGLPAVAMPHLLKNVEARPQDPSFRYHLGVAYAQIKEPAKARVELEQALKLSNSFSGATDARRLLDTLK